MNIREAAQARSAAVRQVTDRPSQRRSAEERGSLAVVHAEVLHRSAPVPEKAPDGSEGVRLHMYASITERAYDMWDSFGPYAEVVSSGAFAQTLAASPLVEFTENHGAGGGRPMAHTRNGTLDLGVDENGFWYSPLVDPTRTDVADMLKAYTRGDYAESSFKFRIDSGKWSPDYTEYRIEAVNLDRGDVSIVNFGANPYTADYSPARAAVQALEARVARALSDPERTSVATILGLASAASDSLDDVVEALAVVLGVDPEALDPAETGAMQEDAHSAPVDLRAALLSVYLAD